MSQCGNGYLGEWFAPYMKRLAGQSLPFSMRESTLLPTKRRQNTMPMTATKTGVQCCCSWDFRQKWPDPRELSMSETTLKLSFVCV